MSDLFADVDSFEPRNERKLIRKENSPYIAHQLKSTKDIKTKIRERASAQRNEVWRLWQEFQEKQGRVVPALEAKKKYAYQQIFLNHACLNSSAYWYKASLENLRATVAAAHWSLIDMNEQGWRRPDLQVASFITPNPFCLISPLGLIVTETDLEAFLLKIRDNRRKRRLREIAHQFWISQRSNMDREILAGAQIAACEEFLKVGSKYTRMKNEKAKPAETFTLPEPRVRVFQPLPVDFLPEESGEEDPKERPYAEALLSESSGVDSPTVRLVASTRKDDVVYRSRKFVDRKMPQKQVTASKSEYAKEQASAWIDFESAQRDSKFEKQVTWVKPKRRNLAKRGKKSGNGV